jgi:hypothetical protein
MDRLRKIGNIESRITELLQKVPGYNGYRDKENRRDEDKRLRDSIANDVQNNVARLTQYNANLSAARELSHLSRVESLVGQLRLLADRIRTASYGYGGIFTEREVDAAALDQLRQFDLALQREVTSLGEEVETLTSSTPPRDDDVRSLSGEIDRLQLLFDTRTEVVDRAKPTRDAKVLELLDTNEPATPSPLLSVSKGDTLSVLGDNFIANATISLATDQGPLQLIRVSEEEGGATWLLGSGVEGIVSARLTESLGEMPPYQTMQRAAATLDTENGRQEGVAVQYAARMTGGGELELTVVFGDSARVYRGNEIRDIDVEVYGAA